MGGTHQCTYFGHGQDDTYVDIKMARRAVHLLKAWIGLYVTSKEYEGAEREARCWLKGPEELDDVVNFLEMHVLGKFSLDMD